MFLSEPMGGGCSESESSLWIGRRRGQSLASWGSVRAAKSGGNSIEGSHGQQHFNCGDSDEGDRGSGLVASTLAGADAEVATGSKGTTAPIPFCLANAMILSHTA